MTEFVALATTTLLVLDVPILLLRTTIRQRPLTMGLAYMQCVTSPQTIKRFMMELMQLELLLSSAQMAVAVVLVI